MIKVKFQSYFIVDHNSSKFLLSDTISEPLKLVMNLGI